MACAVSARPTARGVGGPTPLALAPGTLPFTFCHVPVVYRLADAARTTVVRRDGEERTVPGAFLDPATSRELFERTGAVARIDVDVPASALVAAPR